MDSNDSASYIMQYHHSTILPLFNPIFWWEKPIDFVCLIIPCPPNMEYPEPEPCWNVLDLFMIL